MFKYWTVKGISFVSVLILIYTLVIVYIDSINGSAKTATTITFLTLIVATCIIAGCVFYDILTLKRCKRMEATVVGKSSIIKQGFLHGLTSEDKECHTIRLSIEKCWDNDFVVIGCNKSNQDFRVGDKVSVIKYKRMYFVLGKIS